MTGREIHGHLKELYGELLPWEWKRLREADKPTDQQAATPSYSPRAYARVPIMRPRRMRTPRMSTTCSTAPAARPKTDHAQQPACLDLMPLAVANQVRLVLDTAAYWLKPYRPKALDQSRRREELATGIFGIDPEIRKHFRVGVTVSPAFGSLLGIGRSGSTVLTSSFPSARTSPTPIRIDLTGGRIAKPRAVAKQTRHGIKRRGKSVAIGSKW